MDVADLMDDKLNEREPFGFLMTVDGPAEASIRASVGASPPGATVGTPVPGSAPSAEELEQLTADMVAALKTVYDPEIPSDIYELGLIYKIDIDDDRNVAILMTLTAPGCPVAGEMPQWVENGSQAYRVSVRSQSRSPSTRRGTTIACRMKPSSRSTCSDGAHLVYQP
jgi:metal-sulfur cluster biosynthetic enzyme